MPRITVPRFLAAALLATSPACRDEDTSDDGADTSTTTATTTTETSEASGSTGPTACVDITEEVPCDAGRICAWDGVCHVHCPKIPTEDECMMQGFLCYWVEGACDYGGV